MWLMSDKKLRLFVAADIPGEARELIYATVQGLRTEVVDARWVKPTNLHLTLKFIGEYGEEGLHRLSNELRAAAERCRAFKAALGGCGAFPSQRKARVIWVGMYTGVEEAGAIAKKLDARLRKIGVKREERLFRGHLTLARLKRPCDCTDVLEDMADRLKGLQDLSFEVEEIVLYRSILSPQGPMYNALERIRLGGVPREEG